MYAYLIKGVHFLAIRMVAVYVLKSESMSREISVDITKLSVSFLTTLLAKFWRISLYVTVDAIAKLY